MGFNLKIKLNGKQLYQTNLVKYFCIRTDNKLNWKAPTENIAIKVNKANAMLYEVRDYVNAGILKSISYVLLESHIHCACIKLGENACTINCLLYSKRRQWD